MSPLSVRRYRAERLLREEFERMRARVLANVRGRLRVRGVSLDERDLDACYAQAWQGLYLTVLNGEEIASPAGWLTLVTFRRAIEEHRARGRAHVDTGHGSDRVCASSADPTPPLETAGAADRDLAAELDDRVRLRRLFEGLRGGLDERERQAAALCYLQGLTRSEAASRMGLSDGRMRKLMEGRGPARPGVANKVGALVETIRDDRWCQQQGSLMRALAYGILDPAGERHRLALMHRSQCPACRSYVASLRGLAAALPPVFLPWGVPAGLLAPAAEGLRSGAAAAPSGHAGGVAGVTGAGAGGAAGGGWVLGAGPLGAKLAVGCALALGVGAGCVAIDRGSGSEAHERGRQLARRGGRRGGAAGAAASAVRGPLGLTAGAGAGASARAPVLAASASAPPGAAARASREFGPERSPAPTGAPPRAAATGAHPGNARSASSTAGSSTPTSSTAGSAGEEQGGRPLARSAQRGSAGDSPAAEREFAPG